MPVQRKHKTLWSKIGMSFIAFAVFWGWLSITGMTLPISWVVFIAIALIVLCVYWHVVGQFVELKADIKFIRSKIEKIGGSKR